MNLLSMNLVNNVVITAEMMQTIVWIRRLYTSINNIEMHSFPMCLHEWYKSSVHACIMNAVKIYILLLFCE